MSIFPNCKAEVQNESHFCPECGTKLTESVKITNKNKNKNQKGLLLRRLTILGLIGVVLLFGCDSSNKKDEDLTLDDPAAQTTTTSGDTAQTTTTTKPGANENDPPQTDNEVISVEAFLKLVAGSEYAKAIEYYNNNLEGNLSFETDARVGIENQIVEINVKVLSGEYKESDVDIRLSVIDKVVKGTDITPVDYQKSLDKIEASLDSKSAYNAATELEALKNYADAIEQYRLVIEGDSNYANAEQAIIRCTTAHKQAIFDKAQTLAASADYSGAISALRTLAAILPDDNEVQTKITVYEKMHINTAITNAENAFVKTTEDYQKALDYINGALQFYPENEALLEKKTYYSKFRPVDLYNMTPIKGGLEKQTNMTSTYNEKYSNCFVIDSSMYKRATYVIDSKYNVFTATIFGCSSNTAGRSNYLMIYCDGVLVYENTRILDNGKSFEISIDLTGVNELEIYMEQTTSSSGYGLSNMILQRTAK